MSIKAVVFDYGGVICFFQDPAVLDTLAGMAGVKREAMEPVFWSLRNEYDRGTQTAMEYYRTLFDRLKVKVDDSTMEKMIDIDIFSWKNINPLTVKLMEDLKTAGLKVAILSNMPHDFLAWARGALPAFSLPDAAVFSCEVNSVKPEEEIYRKLFAELNVPPGEMVFFDDAKVNIEKARELGMNAFVWEGPEETRKKLAEMGVLLE